MDEQTIKYREILLSPIRECASYSPKFGHTRRGGFSFDEFLKLYGTDAFYKWLGLDCRAIYAAHKTAGGITSVYRQIGIGCERLVREIFKDYLGLSSDDVKWSYTVNFVNNKERTLALDGRIIVDKITDLSTRQRIKEWMHQISRALELPENMENAMIGVVFEVRQGYKSKDSKRQNGDISNASNAYANGYIPCLMVMSSQIDDDIIIRYKQSKWGILQGYVNSNCYESTFQFFKDVIGFDFISFMEENQTIFQTEIRHIVEQLLRAE